MVLKRTEQECEAKTVWMDKDRAPNFKFPFHLNPPGLLFAVSLATLYHFSLGQLFGGTSQTKHLVEGTCGKGEGMSE